MKNFFSNLIDWLGLSLLLCNGFYLVGSITAIGFGQFDAPRNSVHGWHGSHVLFLMVGMPLISAVIFTALDSAVNKLNSKV